jgi:pimeloyl-ACP methyl ester carboxylesterase
MSTALTVIAAIAVLYLGILALLWRFQERIVFQPPVDPESPDSASSTIAYTSRDGVRLMALVVEPARRGGPVILAFHGNAMISRWMLPWAREVSRRFDATVVLPEYRGYDGLDGSPTYEGSALDALAAVDAAKERFQVPSTDLVYYGHSLGSAIATELAATTPPRALLLESPFTSARDMAARMPMIGLGLFWRVVSRVHYDTRDQVTRLDVPVHVTHGERDVIIPARMGRTVHATARRQGGLLLVAEADHNDVPIAGGDNYWRWFEEALRQEQH